MLIKILQEEKSHNCPNTKGIQLYIFTYDFCQYMPCNIKNKFKKLLLKVSGTYVSLTH